MNRALTSLSRSAGVLAHANGHALERDRNCTGLPCCRGWLRASTPALRDTLVWLPLILLLTGCHLSKPPLQVGPSGDSGMIVPTMQALHPAGRSIEFHGRPIDLLLAPDGRTAYLKCDFALFAVDIISGKLQQERKYPNGAGASLHGMALSKDGAHLYVTVAQSAIIEFHISGQKLALRRIIPVRLKEKGQSYPCGIALSPDEKKAYVCLSVDNCLAEVDLVSGDLLRTIPTGLAPFGVKLSPDGKTAYVSNWGGRRPLPKDKTAPSAGSQVVIDDRGIACTGTISILDLQEASTVSEIPVGLHPCDLLLNRGGQLYVANANSDTVTVINTASGEIVQTIKTRPRDDLPFGSAPNALALSEDERTLFIADGGNNAIAVMDLSTGEPRGFIPSGWYPAALALQAKQLFVANVKGLGTRDPATKGKWSTRYGTWGSMNVIDLPDLTALKRYTIQVLADGLVPQALKATEQGSQNHKVVPIPKHPGESSVFRHVVYIIKENRTYDQVLGDIGKGNSDPSLCIYGRKVTPNQHALAEQFVLLDNYYCNGVLSPDGHHWATEGITTDFLEKSFGAWTRSYPSTGDDPLAYSTTGFIWDNALLHGLTFRNYGEFRYDTFDPFAHGGSERTGLLRPPPSTNGVFKPHLGLPAIEPYTCPDFPGYTTEILDVQRAEIFIRELLEFEQNGRLPNLLIVYLPNNHTNGTRPGSRTPNAMVADNDLAVGKVVEAISHCRFWKDTCIFVTEDDPQDGFDHVDGHRSPCLVISAYTKRHKVISAFYNQTSVLHTIELMLGLPPMNQFDAMAPAMTQCFMKRPDLTPFSAVPNIVSLNERNPARSALHGEDLEMADLSLRLPLDQPDCADEDSLNRVLWHAARPNEPYPIAFAGAHGKGLARLHLRLDGAVKDDD